MIEAKQKPTIREKFETKRSKICDCIRRRTSSVSFRRVDLIFFVVKLAACEIKDGKSRVCMVPVPSISRRRRPACQRRAVTNHD